MHQNRLDKLLKNMRDASIPQLILSDPNAIFYLTGKWIHPGERMLALYLNVSNQHLIFINELFPVHEELGIDKVWFKDTDDPIQLLAQYIQPHTTIGVDKSWPAMFLLDLMKYKKESTFVNGSSLIDTIRMTKDKHEIRLMREASKTNDFTMTGIINLISEHTTEKKMTQLVNNIYEELETEGPSFSPIIAYGANGADPHHSPDHSQLKKGDSIIIDIGCRMDSYCSDMTRTVFYRAVSPKAKEVYHIVKEANRRAISAVKPGVKFCDIDSAARDYIESKGYGEYFTHRTGHSIGLEVHDYGDVSAINTDTVAPGMIFSIEPGIYLPGEFGVRIEDLVLVTKSGCEVLNQFSKDLQIVE
ncbi:peptidase M24 [Alkaliphilus metalliredigens QYMF]|uniref:Peptidase M24 n=1 Tax=Alkaliphilus metalliredigens (strain QYMF) TaxID=293826 RepID=A6TTE8_ALKMQ|nr:Xaa-Pro peptidase family protein [Alkaliphilus metalliredigens]ABR49466.1 peptidase M24 [Alkaliphilus metalliredigens QYMF]